MLVVIALVAVTAFLALRSMRQQLEQARQIDHRLMLIDRLRSESREGVSNITIEFDLSREIDVAAQDVRDRVSRVRGRLPQDIREPIIAKQDSDVALCNQTALDGALMLDRMEDEDARRQSG